MSKLSFLSSSIKTRPLSEEVWERTKPNSSCEGDSRWGGWVNPGRHGTDGAIRRSVRCLWEVKQLLFLFFLNYGLSAPVYQSKARTEEKEQRELTKGENPTSLGSTDPKENFQSPEVENNAIAAVEETRSAWQPCWAVGRHSHITAAQYASLRIVGHRGAERTSCSCRKPSYALGIVTGFSTLCHWRGITRCLVCALGKTEEWHVLPRTSGLALICFQAGFVLPWDITAESSIHHRTAAISYLWVLWVEAKAIHGAQCSKKAPSDELHRKAQALCIYWAGGHSPCACIPAAKPLPDQV